MKHLINRMLLRADLHEIQSRQNQACPSLFAGVGRQVFGISIEDRRLEEYGEFFELQKADDQWIPFSDGYFDVIVSFDYSRLRIGAENG